MIDFTGPSRTSGDNTRYQHCPGCGGGQYAGASWGLSVHNETGEYHCFRCGLKGRADMGIAPNTLLGSLTPRQPGPVDWPEVALPEWRRLSRTGRKYLRDRGILKPEQFGIVELVAGGRVLIPYLGPEGRIIYWVTRSFIDDGQAKYIGAPGRKPPYVLPEWGRHVAIVYTEGVFDALLHHLATGLPTVALGGKSVPAYLRGALDTITGGTATLLLDPDALDATLSLTGVLDAAVVHLPGGMDPADYYKDAAIVAQEAVQ